MGYKAINNVGSPRIELENKLRQYNILTDVEPINIQELKETPLHIFEGTKGYYFTEDLLNKNFVIGQCITAKTSIEFARKTQLSRPRINYMIEQLGRVVYLECGYYELGKFREYLKSNIKFKTEKRGRKKKEKL